MKSNQILGKEYVLLLNWYMNKSCMKTLVVYKDKNLFQTCNLVLRSKWTLNMLECENRIKSIETMHPYTQPETTKKLRSMLTVYN